MTNRFTVGYSEQTDRAYVEDGNFDNDARLYINGDFESAQDQMRYANRIAILLNAGLQTLPELKWK